MVNMVFHLNRETILFFLEWLKDHADHATMHTIDADTILQSALAIVVVVGAVLLVGSTA
jgi:hypothetical protein